MASAASTAAEVTALFKKASDAAADADGNSASEDRCVDALKVLCGLDLPVKLFIDGALSDVAKSIKKMAKKGPTEGVRKAADECMSAWKRLLTGGGDAAEEKKEDGVKKESGGGGGESKGGGESGAGGEGAGGGGGAESPGGASGETPVKTLKELLGPSLSDTLRDRTRELLAEAIALCVGRPGVYASLEDAAQVATSIEHAMCTKWSDTGKEYKAKFRQLSFNLKDPKNPDLRASVADGFISAAHLLELSPEDLGSNDKRSNNEKIREHATNEAVRGIKKEASTDAFKCGKCGKRMCTYYQLQTRSADEPMTTFVTCVNCDNRWKFC